MALFFFRYAQPKLSCSRSGRFTLLLRLAFPFTPVPRLQGCHTKLAYLGISLEEGGEGVGLDDGRQLDLLLGLTGLLPLAVRGAYEYR